MEEKLVSSVNSALQKEPELKVKWFLDKGRGCRKVRGKSSSGMLTPLCMKYGERHNVYLYTPVLSENLVTQFLPPRWNEILSVYHIKSYIFDDNMIISGANLSNDYFTTRIDRYVLFENCPELINYYEKFFAILSEYCSTISAESGRVSRYMSSNRTHNEFRSRVMELLRTGGDATCNASHADVLIYPTFQQEALNLTADYTSFKGVLDVASRFEDTDLYLTSGYVNFPAEIVDVLSKYRGKMRYLFAAPQANSFFHDPGFASVIPALYNILQCNFFHRCQESRADAHFLEYLNKDWTYHSKGLWLLPRGRREALVTIGSPNFGMRSYFRDMESQLYMISESEEFRAKFEQEAQYRFHNKDTMEVTADLFDSPERFPPHCPLSEGRLNSFLKMMQGLL